jgi:hypothetical protein
MTTITDVNTKKCARCDGLGYKEYEAGIIRLRCRDCGGTGLAIEIQPEAQDLYLRQLQPNQSKGAAAKRQALRPVNAAMSASSSASASGAVEKFKKTKRPAWTTEMEE